MTKGFKVVQEMIRGLSDWMDEKGHASLADNRGRALPNVTDWNFLNLNYVTKAGINHGLVLVSGDHPALKDLVLNAKLHPGRTPLFRAIAMRDGRVFEVQDDECLACILCVDVCPVDG